jgi:hypothetical protein
MLYLTVVYLLFQCECSLVAPHVSASVALLQSHFNDCKPSQIRFVLSITASHPKNNGGCDTDFGYGIVQLRAAFDWLTEMGGCGGWDAHLSATFTGCGKLDESDIVLFGDEEEQNVNIDSDNGESGLDTPSETPGWLGNFLDR